MGNGFNVITDELRVNQKSFTESGTKWTVLQNAARGRALPEGALGLLGRTSGVVADYNATVAHLVDELGKGATRLATAGAALDKCAKVYEAKDESYYRKFGYTSEDLRKGG